jgi:hypothetical protein
MPIFIVRLAAPWLDSNKGNCNGAQKIASSRLSKPLAPPATLPYRFPRTVFATHFNMQRVLPFCRGLALLIVLLSIGCAHTTRNLSTRAPLSVEGLSAPAFVDTVDAVAAPPIGWQRDPLRKSAKHTHEVWIAPSGSTCYGVMHFSLPLPVGQDLVLWGFLREMERKQGEAKLLSSKKDPQLPGTRFVAEGGKYLIRVNLLTKGWEGWAVYAGTLRDQPVQQKELDLAERAREYTVTGKPKAADKSDLARTTTGKRSF